MFWRAHIARGSHFRIFLKTHRIPALFARLLQYVRTYGFITKHTLNKICAAAPIIALFFATEIVNIESVKLCILYTIFRFKETELRFLQKKI